MPMPRSSALHVAAGVFPVSMVWVEMQGGLVAWHQRRFLPCTQGAELQLLRSVNHLAQSCSRGTTASCYGSCWSWRHELKPGLGLPTLGVERDWQH